MHYITFRLSRSGVGYTKKGIKGDRIHKKDIKGNRIHKKDIKGERDPSPFMSFLCIRHLLDGS